MPDNAVPDNAVPDNAVPDNAVPDDSAPDNSAAWLPAARAPLSVGPAQMPRPAPDEVIVRVGAVAINPVDWIIQGTGQISYRWMRYPTVLGTDVAGVVTEIGSAVTRFAVGDRVFGLATGSDRGRDPLHEGAFQQYTALLERLTAAIPPGMAAEQAAVLPLGISTAACGLFQSQNLGLELPGSSQPHDNEVVVVWGGSTSVGLNAIQLARLAGYRVISTASPKNFDLLRSLGAEGVFDYRRSAVVDDIVTAIAGRRVVGALAVGAGSADLSLAVLRRTGGTRLALSSTPVSLADVSARPRLFPAIIPVFARLGTSMAALMVRARRAGVRTNFIWGSSLRDDTLGPALWRDIIPAGLADGTLRALPEPLVVGEGLGAIQDALQQQRRGVSARKLVVTLPGND